MLDLEAEACAILDGDTFKKTFKDTDDLNAFTNSSSPTYLLSLTLTHVLGFQDAFKEIKEVVENINRPYETSSIGPYADAGGFAYAFKDKHRDCLPKTGVYVGVGLGRFQAKHSIFEQELKAPNAIVVAGASMESLSAKAYAKAELVSASTSVGPVKATVGLAADTGATLDLCKFTAEAKVVGTGFCFGRKMGVSLFGTGVEFKLW